MKILVSGVSGFIGVALTETLLERDDVEYVVGISRYPHIFYKHYKNYINCNLDITKHSFFISHTFKPDVVFHLAAMSNNSGSPTDIYETNIFGTHNLLQHFPANCKFVLASSSAVYGDNAYNLGRPSQETDLLCPTSVYGASKVSAEALLTVSGINGVAARLVSTIGTAFNHGAVYDIIKKLYSQNEALELYGPSPGSIKPYIHIDDCVAALIKLGLGPTRCFAYNVCNKYPLCIRDVAETIMSELKVHKEIKWIDNKVVGDNRLVDLDDSRLRSTRFRLQCNTSIDAIKQVCQDIRKAAQPC